MFLSTSKSAKFRGRDLRKAPRRKIGSQGWIRVEGGFAVRRCKVIDMSNTGLQIAVQNPETFPSTFSFLETRTGHGRRARVVRRRGSEIGATFE